MKDEFIYYADGNLRPYYRGTLHYFLCRTIPFISTLFLLKYPNTRIRNTKYSKMNCKFYIIIEFFYIRIFKFNIRNIYQIYHRNIIRNYPQ